MPGSAMRAVATGTHTPHVTRSTSIGATNDDAPSISSSSSFSSTSLENMPSPNLNISPYISPTVLAMSSNRKNNPAHSPLGPPSSNLPTLSLDLTIGMMATRAKELSASDPRPSSARPRRAWPIMRSRSDRFFFSLSFRERSSFEEPLPVRSPSSALPPSDSSSARRRAFAIRPSRRPTRHLAVSLSSLRILGARRIKNRDFSMIAPSMPPPLSTAGSSFRDGRTLSPPASPSLALSAPPPPARVKAETSAELDCNSRRRRRVV
mmetsp:Transcript_18709/g.45002  ORF Transcript_18709/g.45002 Transcript_18709/m.45002 type:complete len:264 (-) Transcript_18709:100-891(-)